MAENSRALRTPAPISSGRRAVLHAVWAAPAITVVAAAPAFAAYTLTFGIASFTGTRPNGNKATLDVAVSDISLVGNGSVASQTAIVTVPAARKGKSGNWSYPAAGPINSGWTLSSTANNTTEHTTTFTFTGAIALAGGGTPASLTFTATVSASQFALGGSISVTVGAIGGTSASSAATSASSAATITEA
ncbi:MAG: hypothetical protein ACSLEW_10175 [Nocardioides sp.]